MKALGTLTYYTGIQFARDKVALFWTLAFPVVLMVIIGYAFGESGTALLPVGLVIEDRGPAGQAVAGALAGYLCSRSQPDRRKRNWRLSIRETDAPSLSSRQT